MEENELQTLEATKPQKQRDKQSVGNDFDRFCFVWVHKKDAGNSLDMILIGLLRWGLKKGWKSSGHDFDEKLDFARPHGNLDFRALVTRPWRYAVKLRTD